MEKKNQMQEAKEQWQELFFTGEHLDQLANSMVRTEDMTFKQQNDDANRQRNRYTNIRAPDRAVVPTSDGTFVNSSRIDLTHFCGEPLQYIATQGPLPHTTFEFWDMVHHEQASMIVMLTNFYEEGRCKCHYYFPGAPEHPMEGSMRVEALGETDGSATRNVRNMRVTKQENGAVHELRHFHFFDWPDGGNPRSEDEFMRVVGEIEEQRQRAPGKPIVVHCSAGVGRTAVFILVHAMMRRIANGLGAQQNNVPFLLANMRSARPDMGWVTWQLRFAMECIQKHVLN